MTRNAEALLATAIVGLLVGLTVGVPLWTYLQ